MKIKTQAVNFNAQDSLLEYLEKKTNKLELFYDKIVGAKVFMKLENTSEKNNKSIDFILEVPGDDLVVKKVGQSFEECIDLAVDTLKKMIIKKKEKIA